MERTGHGLRQSIRRRLAATGDRLARARHFRGHGVHSPFVYALVREVFMQAGMLPGDRTLYRALRAAGMKERPAVQLQNLAIHEGYATFGLNRADGAFCIATAELPPAELPALAEAARETGATLAIAAPHADAERQAQCSRLVAAHASTSVDNRACLLLFNNQLPKQHFRL